ncbi:MAG: DUF2800 domain-containing protein [Sphingosinicella sp.]|nr:DUF2800 domain-containing protein [Sphingosinicella sp.]
MNVPEKIHAELGASVAARWMVCPGSVRLSRGQANYETEHSRAGTAAHALAELCLRKGHTPDVYEGVELEGVEVDQDMIDAVAVYVNYCRAIPRGNSWIEHRFSLAALNPPAPMFGTCDFAAHIPLLRELEVVDYKNGSGVVVEVKGNKQLRYYALGALLELGQGLEVETVKITIVQPRAGHPDGAIRSEVIPVADLLAFADELMAAARATLEPDAPLNPGAHCRFCPASPICPAQRAQVESLVQVAFDAMPLDVPPTPESLTPEALSHILHHLPQLEDWAKNVRTFALRQLEAGGVVVGQKLVERRATRRWVSEGQVESWLREEKQLADDEIFIQKLKSPAQLEKLPGMKKVIPAGFIEKKSSGYTMVPDADARPALVLNPGDAFDALPVGD